MRFRKLLLIIGSLALASGVILTAISITRPSEQEAKKGTQTSAILIAAHHINSGTLLRAEDMRWQDVTASSVAQDNLERGKVAAPDYVGAVAMRDFAEGQPLLHGALIKPQDRNFLAAVLAPGMRAVTVTANASQSVAGLLRPGDHIDVILTQRFNDPQLGPARQVAGETVLRNVRVIAIDQRLAVPSDLPTTAQQGRVSEHLPGTITLEVSQRNAEKLLVATELGNLGLALRPFTGHSEASPDTTTIWAADVSAALSTLGGASSNTNPKGPDQWSSAPVQVIHGGQTEQR